MIAKIVINDIFIISIGDDYYFGYIESIERYWVYSINLNILKCENMHKKISKRIKKKLYYFHTFYKYGLYSFSNRKKWSDKIEEIKLKNPEEFIKNIIEDMEALKKVSFIRLV